MWKKIKSFIFALLIFGFYKALTLTWRLRAPNTPELEEDIKNGVPIVFAMWHGHELAMIAYSKHYHLATMTSVSVDGQTIKWILRWFGLATSEGSSSRNAIQGLKGLMRLAKAGHIPVIPVDGPRGPIYEPKPGIFEVSRLLNAKIYPGAIAASSSFVFKKSWNKAILPHPFAKVPIYWGDPIGPITKDMDPRDPKLAQQLKDAINAAGQSALKEIAP